jgi:hypothetical protein
VRLVQILVAAALLIAAVAYLNFSTLSPCGVLRETVRHRDGLAAVLPDSIIDLALSSQYGPLTPGRCLAVLMSNPNTPHASRPQTAEPAAPQPAPQAAPAAPQDPDAARGASDDASHQNPIRSAPWVNPYLKLSPGPERSAWCLGFLRRCHGCHALSQHRCDAQGFRIVRFFRLSHLSHLFLLSD